MKTSSVGTQRCRTKSGNRLASNCSTFAWAITYTRLQWTSYNSRSSSSLKSPNRAVQPTFTAKPDAPDQLQSAPHISFRLSIRSPLFLGLKWQKIGKGEIPTWRKIIFLDFEQNYSSFTFSIFLFRFVNAWRFIFYIYYSAIWNVNWRGGGEVDICPSTHCSARSALVCPPSIPGHGLSRAGQSDSRKHTLKTLFFYKQQQLQPQHS